MAAVSTQVRPMHMLPNTPGRGSQGHTAATATTCIANSTQSGFHANKIISTQFPALIGQPQVLATVLPSISSAVQPKATHQLVNNPQVAHTQPLLITSPAAAIQPGPLQNSQVSSPVYQLVNVSVGGKLQALLVPVQQISQLPQPTLVQNSPSAHASLIASVRPPVISLLPSVTKSVTLPAGFSGKTEEMIPPLIKPPTGKRLRTSDESKNQRTGLENKGSKRKKGCSWKSETSTITEGPPMFKIDSVYSLSDSNSVNECLFDNNDQNDLTINNESLNLPTDKSEAENEVVRGDSHQVLAARHVVAQLMAQQRGNDVTNQACEPSNNENTGEMIIDLVSDEKDTTEVGTKEMANSCQKDHGICVKRKQTNSRKQGRFSLKNFATNFTTLIERRNEKSKLSNNDNSPAANSLSHSTKDHRTYDQPKIQKDITSPALSTSSGSDPLTTQEFSTVKPKETIKTISKLGTINSTSGHANVFSWRRTSSAVSVVPPFTSRLHTNDSETARSFHAEKLNTNEWKTSANDNGSKSPGIEQTIGLKQVNIQLQPDVSKKYESLIRPCVVLVQRIDIGKRLSIHINKLQRQRKSKRLLKKKCVGLSKWKVQDATKKYKPKQLSSKKPGCVHVPTEIKACLPNKPCSNIREDKLKNSSSVHSPGQLLEDSVDDASNISIAMPVAPVVFKSNTGFRRPAMLSNKDRARANLHNILCDMVHKKTPTHNLSASTLSNSTQSVSSLLHDQLNLNCQTDKRLERPIAAKSQTCQTAATADVTNHVPFTVIKPIADVASQTYSTKSADDIVIIDLSSTSSETESSTQPNPTDQSLHADLHNVIFSESVISASVKPSSPERQQERKPTTSEGREERIRKLKTMLQEQQKAVEEIRVLNPVMLY